MVEFEKDKKEITFTYHLEAIFNGIADETAFIARDKVNELGETLIDELIITRDEMVFVEGKFQNVAMLIFSMLENLAVEVENPYSCEDDKIVINIKAYVDDRGEMIASKHRLTALDNFIVRYIEGYILAEWLNIKNLSDLMRLKQEELRESMKSALVNIRKLNRPYVRKSYSHFHY